jgi:hypothetical protein
MSPVAVALKPEQAEAKASEIANEIVELEQFLSEVDARLDEAELDRVRTGRTGEVAVLEKKRDQATRRLPSLRRQLAAVQTITQEHQAEVAAARRAELQVEGDELDALEREKLAEVVDAFRGFADATSAWKVVQSRRQGFQLANRLDLPDYKESALEAIDVTGVPRTLTQVFERVHKAALDPDSVGDVRHLQGWQEFT